ncbi:MAG TPA: nuclear transport factor 2 family protein [Thermoanaerobaculia bacterium]|nr:nuclear transport factor 2 family protein [Thermoanaerobaculia bacterium]
MEGPGPLAAERFRTLMAELASAWNVGDAEAAAALFAEDAVYLDPGSRKFYRGRATLKDLFDRTAKRAPMKTTWRHLFFDEATQTGAAEFSFEWGGHAYAGVAIVLLENGLVSRWREYQVEADSAFEPVAG